jgi:hypothetical protein
MSVPFGTFGIGSSEQWKAIHSDFELRHPEVNRRRKLVEDGWKYVDNGSTTQNCSGGTPYKYKQHDRGGSHSRPFSRDGGVPLANPAPLVLLKWRTNPVVDWLTKRI